MNTNTERTLTPSGIPTGLTGVAAAPPGLVPAPDEDTMLGWRRQQVASPPGAGAWLLGVHGGSGAGALSRTLAAAKFPVGDAGRAWPVPDGRPVIVVARTHGRGRTAAMAAARQHLSGYSPPRTWLAGCVLVPDGPGRLPKEILSAVVGQVAGVFAHTWVLPWAEELRLLDPDLPGPWPHAPDEVHALIEGIRSTATPTAQGA